MSDAPLLAGLDAPAGGLPGLLHVLADRPGLCCSDLGEAWTVLTWASGPALCWSRAEETAPTARAAGDWKAAARARLRPAPPPPGGLPFAGGLAGWIAYEAGATCERMPMPAGPRALPDVALWPCAGAIVHHRRADRWQVAGTPAFLAQARDARDRARPRPDTPAGAAPGLVPREGTREHYVAAVREALARIRAGDLYQVNLAWSATGRAPTDPVGAWLALREANPAARGALMRGPEVEGQPTWLLSNSPERYVDARPTPDGLRVHSTPIKGTALRAGGEAARQALASSEKEQAELTMIADLVRNDLGRVARPGTVVAAPRRITACGDLWHAEQDVAATLRPGLDALDLLGATFPPGSVTGAPKVSAMSTIGALETGPRGPYTGAHGLLGDDGSAWLSVAIRVAAIRGDRATVHVGAGIVADSDPAAEWEETLAKGHALAAYAFAPEEP